MKQSYYNENRYFDADVTAEEIKLEIDASSPVYTDYEHGTIEKQESIKILEEYVAKDSTIRDIIDNIPDAEKKKRVVLTIEESNKIYSFACIKLEKHEYTKIEIFDIVTSYLHIKEKTELINFYSKLSTKFKEQLLVELEAAGMYKSNKLF